MLALIISIVLFFLTLYGIAVKFGNWPTHYEPEETIPLDEHEETIS